MFTVTVTMEQKFASLLTTYCQIVFMFDQTFRCFDFFEYRRALQAIIPRIFTNNGNIIFTLICDIQNCVLKLMNGNKLKKRE